MNRACGGSVARGLERLLDPGTVAGLSERQLLARFVERGDPVAFEALVVRHGPPVLSVCRHMLRDANDVDDAFQATFVILFEKARSLKQPERLSAWLYGVAHRVASRTRRRRRTQGLPGDLAGRSAGEHLAEVEDLALVHNEIQRLPEKYRLPIVLCCVNEESHDAAARALGWPVGTVHGRVVRGRDLLRARLLRRGMVIPEAVLRQGAAGRTSREKAVPEPLLRSTLALLSGTIPKQLRHLVKGALSAMFIEKLRTTGLVLGLTTLGVASAATALMAFQQPEKKAVPPAGNSASQEPAAVTKKGKALRKAANDPFVPVAGASAEGEAEEERATEEVATMRAKVDLLEIENDALRTRIQRAMAWLEQVDDPFPGERDSFTAEQLEEQRKNLQEMRARRKHQLEGWNKSYLKNRIEIAHLNRRIGKITHIVEKSARDVSGGKSVDELVRRIDRLEAKLDRLADSIRTGSGGR